MLHTAAEEAKARWEGKRENATNSGINGHNRTQCNQQRINVREREKMNKLIQLATLYDDAITQFINDEGQWHTMLL